MKLFLQLGTGVLVGFSLFIIYNTYSIVIQGRKKEFQLLYKLGMKYKKIQQILSIESFLLSSVTAVIGLFTGIVFSRHEGRTYSNLYLSTSYCFCNFIFYMVRFKKSKKYEYRSRK